MRHVYKQVTNLLGKLDPPCLEICAESELGGCALRCGDDEGLGIIVNALEAPVEKNGSCRIGKCGIERQMDGYESSIVTSSISSVHPMRCDLARAQLLGDLGEEGDLSVRTIQVKVKNHRLRKCILAKVEDQGRTMAIPFLRNPHQEKCRF